MVSACFHSLDPKNLVLSTPDQESRLGDILKLSRFPSFSYAPGEVALRTVQGLLRMGMAAAEPRFCQKSASH